MIGSRWERALILGFLAFLVYPLYWPLSHHGLDRAFTPVLGIDEATPLAPIWVWPYTMVYLTALLPICVVRDHATFRQMGLSYLVVMICSFNFFWLFPVRMTLRPESIPVVDLTTYTLMLIYHYDPPSNCFPSMHVSLAVLAALCCWRVDRVWGSLVGLGALAIAASTMLVKQHYVLDVAGGAVLGAVVYRLCVYRLRLPNRPAEELRYPRWLPLVLVGLWLVAAGVVAALYRSGWAPWA